VFTTTTVSLKLSQYDLPIYDQVCHLLRLKLCIYNLPTRAMCYACNMLIDVIMSTTYGETYKLRNISLVFFSLRIKFHNNLQVLDRKPESL